MSKILRHYDEQIAKVEKELKTYQKGSKNHQRTMIKLNQLHRVRYALAQKLGEK